MPTKKPKAIKMKKNRWDDLLARLAIFVSILMIAGGAIGMILIQNEIKKSQDLRQQASVADGKVTVSLDSTGLKPDTQSRIMFKIDTAGVQTDGVQLTFNVVTDALDSPPAFNLIDSAPLQLAFSEIETTTDGYLVSIIALPKNLGQPFSTSQSTDFGYLEMVPNQEGTITLNFDVENSISTVHASNPPTDELTHIATTDFTIQESPENCQLDTDCPNGQICYQPPMPSCPPGVGCAQVMPAKICQDPTSSPSPSPSPVSCPEDARICADGTTVVRIAPDCEFEACPNEPLPTPSPDPTDDPGIGGVEVATCNESCASNNDCAVNLRCYSGQCRLATNVTSESCSNPPDQGLSFSCDEYCSDTNECAGDLICQNNRCRNPENVTSTNCADLSVAQRSSVTKSCNQSCSSNAECDVNLRCYQGACRLATNPGSYSCTSTKKKVVSSSVYGSESKGSNDGSTEPGAMGKKDPSKTSGSVSISDEDDKDTLDMQDGAMTDKENSIEGDKEETALDSVKNYFLANPKLPITLMGIGLGLITALILLSLLKRRKDDDDKPPTPPVSGGMSNKSSGKYEADLQNKINALKKESLQPPQSSVPPAMSPPPANKVQTMRIPENKPVTNETKQVFSNENRSSSMLDKLKNKDITPPSV